MPQTETDLGPGGLLLLALCSANLSAGAAMLEVLSAEGRLSRRDLCRIHDQMSAALDAAEAAAPLELVARARGSIDAVMARVLERTNSGAA